MTQNRHSPETAPRTTRLFVCRQCFGSCWATPGQPEGQCSPQQDAPTANGCSTPIPIWSTPNLAGPRPFKIQFLCVWTPKMFRPHGSFTTKPKFFWRVVQAALQRRGGTVGPSRHRETPRRLAPLPPVPPAWPSADPSRPPPMGSFHLSPANRPNFLRRLRPTGRRQWGQKGPNSEGKEVV